MIRDNLYRHLYLHLLFSFSKIIQDNIYVLLRENIIKQKLPNNINYIIIFNGKEFAGPVAITNEQSYIDLLPELKNKMQLLYNSLEIYEYRCTQLKGFTNTIYNYSKSDLDVRTLLPVKLSDKIFDGHRLFYQKVSGLTINYMQNNKDTLDNFVKFVDEILFDLFILQSNK